MNMGWRTENCVTLVAMVALILGLYWMGAGAMSFWGFLMLFNINGPR